MKYRKGAKKVPQLIYEIFFYFFFNKIDLKNKSLCILGLNPTWSWWTILLMYYWILFAIILFIVFHLVPWSSVLSYPPIIFFKIGFQGCSILIKWIKEFSMLFYNLEPLVKYRKNPLLENLGEKKHIRKISVQEGYFRATV